MGLQIRLFKHAIYQYLHISIRAPKAIYIALHADAKRKLHSPNDNVESLIPCLVLSLSP